MMSHVTVTKAWLGSHTSVTVMAWSLSHKPHAHVIQWNNIEGSRDDDVIQHG